MFLGQSRQIPLKILSKRGRGQSRVTPVFWALNANCSTTVNDADFIFDKHVPWDEKLPQGTRFLNLKSVTFTVVAQLTFDAQKFWGHVTLATPPFRQNFKGD